MKVLAIIFTVVFIVAGILFGLSVAATGINQESAFRFGFYSDRTDEEVPSEYSFTECDFSDISISVLSADARVTVSNDNVTRVFYESTNGSTYVTAESVGGKLTVKEQRVNSGFWLFDWGIFNSGSKLIIELPEADFNRIEYSTASGRGDAVLPNSKKLVISTMSGDVSILAYSENLDISTMSGSTDISNRTQKKCVGLTLSNMSGETMISGFETDSFKISCTSGEVYASGISGRGNVSVTSGDLELDYTEWNDSLKLSVTSGEADIYLPGMSGIDFSASITSGEAKYELDDDRGRINKRDKNVSVGGPNRQSVSLTIMSGDVNFKISERSSIAMTTMIKRENIENMEEAAPVEDHGVINPESIVAENGAEQP